MAPFIQQIQTITARYDGALLQLTIGDKGSLNFGALNVHEDDSQRAVKTALALQEAAHELDWLEPLQIGITHGVMWVGAYGGTTRRTYGALGDTVNQAAWLMQTAVPDEILVSGRIQQTIAIDFAFEPHQPVSLKGKAEPLPVFGIIGTRQHRPIRLQEPTYALPMVRRRAELQTIAVKLGLAQQGEAQLVGIVGEAGLGKSRLVAEVIRLARRKGFVGFGGACQSDGLTTPIWPGKQFGARFLK